MRKKIIFGILLVIFLTGCNAKYNLKIENGTVKEELIIVENNLTIAKKENEVGESFASFASIYGSEYDLNTSFYNIYSDDGCIENCEVYDKEYINDNDKIGFSLKHNFIYEKYGDSTLANEYLPSFQSTFDGKYLTIRGKDPSSLINSYEDLTDITISVESDYRVISSNGKKSGNNYTWQISKEKKKSFDELYIIIDTTEEAVKEENNTLLYIIILIALLIAFATCYILVRKNKTKNAI